jgi:hypothetical protein
MLALKSLPLSSRGKALHYSLSSALCRSSLQFSRSVSTGSTQRDLLRRRVDQKRIRGFLRDLDKALTSDSSDPNVSSNIQTTFTKSTSFRGPLRSNAFENVIWLLFSRRRFSDACVTYERMVSEGFKPTPSLVSNITAVKAITSASGSASPAEMLKKAFEQEEFNEDCLEALINLIPNTNGPGLSWSIVRLFIETRGPGYVPPTGFVFTMGRLAAKLGIKDGARGLFGEDAVDSSGDTILSTYASALQSPEAYVDALNNATATASNEDITTAYMSIISRMVSNKAQANPAVFNALITYDLNRQAYRRVFEFYNVLMRLRSRNLTPDAKTYILLFKAVRSLHNPLRTTRSRKHKPPRNTIPPRLLYKEMLECHLIQTLGRASRKSSVINGIVLDAALRTFMAMKDYVAAFVVVRSFGVYGLRPGVQTYLAVLQPLLAGVKARKDGDWVEQLLKKGEWEEEKGWGQSGLKRFDVEKEVLRRLLKIGVNGGEVTDSEETDPVQNADKEADKERMKALKDFQRLMSASERNRAVSGRKDEEEDELTKEELDAFKSLEGILYAGSEQKPSTEQPDPDAKTDGEKVLAMLEAESSDSAPPSQGRLRPSKSYGIPTLAMLLTGTAPFPYVPKFFDVTPLERILRRAIAASLPELRVQLPSNPTQQPHPSSSRSTPTSANTSRSISHLIRLAKTEMIPEKTEPELRQASRGSLDRRDGVWRFMKVRPRG